MQGTMTVLMTDGTKSVANVTGKMPLKMLQAAVGGLIETVPELETFEGADCVAFSNEEGRINNLPLNEIATAAWKKCIGTKPVWYEPELFGDVVIIQGDEAFMNSL